MLQVKNSINVWHAVGVARRCSVHCQPPIQTALPGTLLFPPYPSLCTLQTTTANCINAWQINARQANAAAASRQVPLGTVDAKADVDAGHRYWHRHTMYALALWGSTHTHMHTHTYACTPGCSCKLKMEANIASHSNANGEQRKYTHTHNANWKTFKLVTPSSPS